MTEPLYLSVSQIAVLTECEQRWVFRKTIGDPEVALGVPLLKGSLLHECCQGWAQGLEWRDVWRQELEATGWEEGFIEPDYFLDAWSIMLAWERVYGAKPSYTVVGRELPFDVEIPGVPDVRIRGYLDELRARQIGPKRTDTEIRVGEYKSMGRWGREKMVPFDPQLWTYIWVARQLHAGVTGATFDALSTHPYKPDERLSKKLSDEKRAEILLKDAQKRFKKIELEWDERQIERNLGYLQAAGRRALELLEEPDRAIRNISQDSCRYCQHHRACLTPWENQ